MKGCHIFQLSRSDKLPMRQFQPRINLNHRPLSRLSMDLKVMPRSYKRCKYILCIKDEVMNYLITILIHQCRLEEIGDSLTEKLISEYCVPDYVVMDHENAFMSSLMNYMLKKLDIKIKNSETLQSSIAAGRTWNKNHCL